MNAIQYRNQWQGQAIEKKSTKTKSWFYFKELFFWIFKSYPVYFKLLFPSMLWKCTFFCKDINELVKSRQAGYSVPCLLTLGPMSSHFGRSHHSEYCESYAIEDVEYDLGNIMLQPRKGNSLFIAQIQYNDRTQPQRRHEMESYLVPRRQRDGNRWGTPLRTTSMKGKPEHKIQPLYQFFSEVLDLHYFLWDKLTLIMLRALSINS